MEMELRETVDDFKNYVNLLKTINPEMMLRITEDGIYSASMDPSHIALIIATLRPSIFQTFEPDEQPLDLTVNLTELLKFLDRLVKKEQVKIRYDEEKAKLVIRASSGGRRRRFELPVLEPLEEEVPTPKIAFHASSRIITESVQRAVKDAQLVSEHIRLEISEKELKISAVGDIGSVYSEWEDGSDELLELKAEEESHATFTLSWFGDCIGALNKVADVVTLELSTDMPLKIVGESTTYCEATLYLAPCIGV